jgi:aspartate racemase
MKPDGYIGLLGLGEESTLHYIKKFNTKWRQLYGAYCTCPLKMLQVDFNTINPNLPFNFDKLIPLVEKHIITLFNMGVDAIVVPNMTLHLTIDQISLPKEIGEKIIHPFTETIHFLKSNKIKNISILGTRHTMNNELINSYFKEAAITADKISSSNIKIIDDLRNAVYDNGANAVRRNEWANINLPNSHKVILCTELSLINNGSTDALEIQIDKAIAKLHI